MNTQREKQILQKILLEKKVTVKELAKELYASEPSIRRDLASLERQNLIKRVHGGAILENISVADTKIPFQIREFEQNEAKLLMAQKAASLVKNNDVIFLDASSSAYTIIPFLANKQNLTVITCGVKALTQLAEYEIDVLSTGGRMIKSCLSLVGERAIETIEKYNADLFFFSCRGLSLDGRLSDNSESEDAVRKCMLAHAKNSYLLCDQTKIGKQYFHNLCHAKELTGVISNAPLPDPLRPYEFQN